MPAARLEAVWLLVIRKNDVGSSQYRPFPSASPLMASTSDSYLSSYVASSWTRKVIAKSAMAALLLEGREPRLDRQQNRIHYPTARLNSGRAPAHGLRL